MRLFPWAATQALAADIRAVTGERVCVTTQAPEASGAVLAGTPAVVLSAPRMDPDHAAVAYTWKAAVVGAPTGDEDAAGRALDELLTTITTTDSLDVGDAEPITWTGSQTTTAPAWLLTLTRRYPTT